MQGAPLDRKRELRKRGAAALAALVAANQLCRAAGGKAIKPVNPYFAGRGTGLEMLLDWRGVTSGRTTHVPKESGKEGWGWAGWRGSRSGGGAFTRSPRAEGMDGFYSPRHRTGCMRL